MKPGLDDIIKGLRIAEKLTKSKDGQIIDLSKERIFTKGVFVHQATDNMSEEESAAFERNNPELFNFLRAFEDQMRDLF